MEELQKSHVLKVEELSRRKMTEDQNTILELRAEIQELQNEVNCMNDSRDFTDAESVRSGLSHVPSQPASLPLCRDPGGMLAVLWKFRAATISRQIFGIRRVYRETFL